MSDEIEHSKEITSVYQRLRRLQHYSRSNMPALMAQRAGSTFTLHNEPLPREANDHALVIVYPQDPFMGEPEVRTMSVTDIQPGLVNSRVRVVDERSELAQPDSDGNYLYWPGTPQFDQVNAFYYTTFTLRMYERYARRMLPWSFPATRITVNPHFGNLANAFYSEQDQLLGFHTFELDGEEVATAWSADVVSHEAAHAILDGLRDLYNESFSLGPLAFHESFGDITAMLVAMHDDSLIRRLLEWTEGNIRRDNFVATVAEQLTFALKNNQTVDYFTGPTVYLRNAINDLVYRPFSELNFHPKDPETELGLQAHNYSRLFTGAFYDVFAGIYEQLNDAMPPHVAIYKARDISAYLLITAIELGPIGELDFSDMARAFLSAERVLYQGMYRSILVEVFLQRGLLTQESIKNWQAHQENLPNLTLPATINSGLASGLFLEEKLLPLLRLPTDTPLIPMSAYRNAAGYAYLSYFSAKTITLDGPQFKLFQGAHVDLFGGLTVMFDTNDKLCSVTYRPVTELDIIHAKVLTENLINQQLVASAESVEGISEQNFVPAAIAVTTSEPMIDPEKTTTQLVKFPVTVDHIPARLSEFKEYLNKMKTNMRRDMD